YFFFFSSRRRHTRCYRDWSSDVCSSDLIQSLFDRFLQQWISILTAQEESVDHGTRSRLLPSSLLSISQKRSKLPGQRPCARHCSSGVEPAKAPGFFVSASK